MYINDTYHSVNIPIGSGSGVWQIYSLNKLLLNAGSNTIKVTNNWGHWYLGSITITEPQPEL